MIFKLLTEHHLEFLSLKEGCKCSSESTQSCQNVTLLEITCHGSFYREQIGDLEVTVTVTPNGYADAVTGGKFVMPEERRMTISKFLDILDKPSSANGVFYIQKQNSNLTDEFGVLLKDVDAEITWGTEAFGSLTFLMDIFLFTHCISPAHRCTCVHHPLTHSKIVHLDG